MMRSRLSNLSALFSVAAALAVAAAPVCARAHAETAASSPAADVAIHATAAVAAPAADRIVNDVPATRRAPHAAGAAAVVARRADWTAGPVAPSRALHPTDSPAASRLHARGYDATAPPLR